MSPPKRKTACRTSGYLINGGGDRGLTTWCGCRLSDMFHIDLVSLFDLRLIRYLDSHTNCVPRCGTTRYQQWGFGPCLMIKQIDGDGNVEFGESFGVLGSIAESESMCSFFLKIPQTNFFCYKKWKNDAP